MALSINSNIQSLNAQRQLVKSGDELSTAMERLSSGKRINSAADDAAGLAISNRMTSQVNGLNRAVSNANDGVSMIQTAEGALDESTNILQRMRELSIQSANGIYGDGDRATLDAEVQQLVAELDRISESTSFNGVNLLDGGLNDVKLQIGAEANQTVSFSIGAMNADSLGLGSTSSDLSGAELTDGAGGITIGDGDIKINGQGLSSFTSTDNAENLQTLINDINTNIDGVTASGFNVVEAATAGTGALDADDVLRITLHSVDGGADTNYDITAGTAGISNLDELAAAINTTTGGAVEASVSDDGKLVLSNTTGGAITTALDGNGAGTFTAADTNTTTILGINDGGTGDTQLGSLSLTSDDGSAITITKGANGTDAQLAALGFRETAAAGEVLGGALAASAQDDALAAGDLTINGTAVGAVTSSSGVMGKIDAINAISDTTGVTASLVSEQAFEVKTGTAATSVEIVTTTTAQAAASGEDITLNGVSVAIASTDTYDDIALTINGNTSSHGVSAFVDTDGQLHMFSTANITLGDTGGTGGVDAFGATAGAVGSVVASAPASGSISINNVEVTITDADDIDQVVTDLNAVQGNTGVHASVDENGELELSSTSGINIQLGTSGDSMAVAYAIGMDALVVDTAGTANVIDETVTINPRIKLDSASDQPISIEVKDTATTTATGLTNMNTDLSSTVTGTSLSSISVATQAGANDAIGSIDQALETINETRSQLGAVSNRLDFTVSNLMNVSENTAAARSRIVDADFAAETAQLSRAQVMQQAASAMLAQANSAPQQVLSLLR